MPNKRVSSTLLRRIQNLRLSASDVDMEESEQTPDLMDVDDTRPVDELVRCWFLTCIRHSLYCADPAAVR
jgi:hypothetical protein